MLQAVHDRLHAMLFRRDDLARLACVLQAASAAVPGGLRLQSVQLRLPVTLAPLILSLPRSQHLTQLSLMVDDTSEASIDGSQLPDPCALLTAHALAGSSQLGAWTVLSLRLC